MTTKLTPIHSRCALFVLAAWLGVLGLASCSSGDEAPAGGRIEHPAQPAPTQVSSAARAQEGGLPPSDAFFTPLDEEIAYECGGRKNIPPRAWSQHVPDRDCTDDGECGDGFCDRGRCAAIWTCYRRYGQRCIDGRLAPNPAGSRIVCDGTCLAGRCRSCISDDECVQERRNPKARCELSPDPPRDRRCIPQAFPPSAHDMPP